VTPIPSVVVESHNVTLIHLKWTENCQETIIFIVAKNIR